MIKTTYHHGNLRNALIESAYRMLSEEGIQNLSLRAVAKRIGVSHNAPYQHFPDKEALIAAVAEQGFHQLTAVVDEAIAQTRDQPFVEQLAAVGYRYVQFMNDYPAYLEVMFGPYPHQHYPELSGAATASLEHLVALVEKGQAEGAIRPISAREIAGTIWMTLHGISTVFRAGKIPSTVIGSRQAPQMADDFVRIICNGILERR